MTDEKIEKMLARLDAMVLKFHALPDGQGIYLGDGQAYPAGQELRSAPLAMALREVLAWRERFGSAFCFEQESGAIRVVR